jgi:hypothetical protein
LAYAVEESSATVTPNDKEENPNGTPNETEAPRGNGNHHECTVKVSILIKEEIFWYTRDNAVSVYMYIMH